MNEVGGDNTRLAGSTVVATETSFDRVETVSVVMTAIDQKFPESSPRGEESEEMGAHETRGIRNIMMKWMGARVASRMAWLVKNRMRSDENFKSTLLPELRRGVPDL